MMKNRIRFTHSSNAVLARAYNRLTAPWKLRTDENHRIALVAARDIKEELNYRGVKLVFNEDGRIIEVAT